MPIVVHGDRLDEPDHHTGFTVIDLTGAQLAGRAFIPMTILDDDPRPALRVGSTHGARDRRAAFASVPVTLNAPSGRDVTVHLRHAPRHRTRVARLRPHPGTLTICGRRDHAARITIVILGDRTHEASERFRVTLESAVHARIADGDANVTVHDDD